MSSGDDVEKLAVDVEQKCSTATVGIVDKTKPAEATEQEEGTAITDKAVDGKEATGSNLEMTDNIVTGDDVKPQQQHEEQQGKELSETAGNEDAVEDAEITFKKPAKHGTEQADVDSKKDIHDLNRNSEDTSSNDKTACTA